MSEKEKDLFDDEVNKRNLKTLKTQELLLRGTVFDPKYAEKKKPDPVKPVKPAARMDDAPIILVDSPSLPNLVSQANLTESTGGTSFLTPTRFMEVTLEEDIEDKESSTSLGIEGRPCRLKMKEDRENKENNSKQSMKNKFQATTKKMISHNQAINLTKDWMGLENINTYKTEFILNQHKGLKVGIPPNIELQIAEEVLPILDKTYANYRKLDFVLEREGVLWMDGKHRRLKVADFARAF